MLMPPPDGYEDGTQSFLSIAQLQFGFAQLQELGGIQVRVCVRHPNSLSRPELQALGPLWFCDSLAAPLKFWAQSASNPEQWHCSHMQRMKPFGLPHSSLVNLAQSNLLCCAHDSILSNFAVAWMCSRMRLTPYTLIGCGAARAQSPVLDV